MTAVRELMRPFRALMMIGGARMTVGLALDRRGGVVLCSITQMPGLSGPFAFRVIGEFRGLKSLFQPGTKSYLLIWARKTDFVEAVQQRG